MNPWTCNSGALWRSVTHASRMVVLAAGLAGWAAPAGAQGVAIPSFLDPRARQERPDLAGLRVLRFLTDEDYPPLNFIGPDGNPTGFAVELARAACETLNLSCTVQSRRFDTLLQALGARTGDVVAAAIPMSGELRRGYAASLPYFRNPARFVARRDKALPAPTVALLAEHPVGVVAGSAHEAYLKTFFPGAKLRSLDGLGIGQAALRRGEIDYLFADAVSLALWNAGTEAAGCCDFAGGPYLESRFFGEGIGFVLRKDDDQIRRALDYALQRLVEDGKYAEIYLRFFPISPY